MNKEEYERRLLKNGTKINFNKDKQQAEGDGILVKLKGVTYRTILEKVRDMLYKEQETSYSIRKLYLQQGAEGKIIYVGDITYDIYTFSRLLSLLHISEPTMYLVKDNKIERELQLTDKTLMETVKIKRGASISAYV